MSDATTRLGLPFLVPGQAQKELHHNEALARLDLALHACVEGELSAPPANPAEGQCWIVSAGATGLWSGKDNSVAGWTTGGWRFIEPLLGMSAHDKISGLLRRWLGTGWNGGELTVASLSIGGKKVVGERQAAVASPSGGTIIDAEARLAIAALSAALKSHGLTD
jgi:hypothetical protein